MVSLDFSFEPFFRSVILLFALLNPFLMSMYLLNMIQTLDWHRFRGGLSGGGAISTVVFIGFAVMGDFFFEDLLQVRFASFLIFGGLVFLVIGLQFMLQGSEAIGALRGDDGNIAETVAVPFMIGPGTISASVLIGSRLDVWFAVGAICVAMVLTVMSLLILKRFYDIIRVRNEAIVRRYVTIAGRVSGLIIGTFAIEMVLQGLDSWLGK